MREIRPVARSAISSRFRRIAAASSRSAATPTLASSTVTRSAASARDSRATTSRRSAYYLGRPEADITGFIDFFCRSMADALGAVRARASEAAAGAGADDAAALRRLDPRKRLLLELFRYAGTATTATMAAHLGLSPRTVSSLVPRWTKDGFLEVADASRRSRSYRLTPPYERLATRR